MSDGFAAIDMLYYIMELSTKDYIKLIDKMVCKAALYITVCRITRDPVLLYLFYHVSP